MLSKACLVKAGQSNKPYILVEFKRHLVSKKQISHLIALKNCNDCCLPALVLIGWKQVERGTRGEH